MKEIIIFVFVLSIFFIAYMFYNMTVFSETSIEEGPYIEYQPEREFYPNETRITTIGVPAVDTEGNGVMATLSVEVRSGIGRTLTDINQILFWIDTQDSIRIAKAVAENITGMDVSEYDIVYSVQTNASVIGGPSAGAAMGVATISALEDRPIKKTVSITGTLNNDGRIGHVSAISAKAKAAKDEGMDLFLVPFGQKSETTYREEKKCETYVFTTVCYTKTIPEKVDIEKEVGIEVEEVSNIQEALKYFLS